MRRCRFTLPVQLAQLCPVSTIPPISSAQTPNRPALDVSTFKRVLFTALLLAAAAWLAWHNSFAGELIHEDDRLVVDNPSIRSLSPPWKPLLIVGEDHPLSGQPVANWTLAVNYAIGGADPTGYRVTNVIIHALAGLTLFGVMRRVLRFRRLESHFARAADALALVISLLWMLHPLQTQSVSYIAQRADSLGGLFYLLTLYAFVRGAANDLPGTRGWSPGLMVSVLACALGMATSDTMVTAPLIVALFDRTFVAGSFAQMWRLRRGYYAALVAAWSVFALLAISREPMGVPAGFTSTMQTWDHVLAQGQAVVHYLRLSLWPHPLVFDYGLAEPRPVYQLLPHAFFLLTLIAFSAMALWQRQARGFLGAWFFLIIAASSALGPFRAMPVAEHRMYLPLAAVIVLIVLGAYRVAGRRSFAMFLALVVTSGFVTARRNAMYSDELALWTDTVNKAPLNARAWNELAAQQLERGHAEAAVASGAQAVGLEPYFKEAHFHLGLALLQANRLGPALRHLEQAAKLDPRFADAHQAVGETLSKMGRAEEAAIRLRAAALLRGACEEKRHALSCSR